MNAKRQTPLTWIAAFLFLSSVAWGQSVQAPPSLPMQALITNASDQPEVGTSISLSVEIEDSAGCILYTEQFTSLTTDNNGMISVALGTGSAQAYAAGISPATFKQVFANPGATVTCLAGSTPTTVPLSTGDGRQVLFTTTGSFAGVTPVTLQSVPYAFSADTLGGMPASGFITTDTSVTQPNLDALTTNVDISAMGMHNHDSRYDVRYAKLGATDNFTGNLLTTGSIGIGTTNPNGNLDVEESSPVVTLGSTSGTGTTSLNFDNVGTATGSIQGSGSSNTLTFLTGGSQALVLDSSQNAHFEKSVAVTGTLGLGQYAAGNSAGQEGSWPTPGAGTLLSALSALGNSAQGTAWYSEGTGVKYWDGLQPQTVASTANSVTALTVSAPLASTGGSTPALSLPQASAVQSGYLASSDWQTFSNKVNRAGDSMTGNLNMSGNAINNLANPVAGTDAVNKSYVITQEGNYLPLTGGTMTGALNFATWNTAGRPGSFIPGTTGFNTTIQQLETWNGFIWVTGSTGSVTNISASAPLNSSGGATPNLTITQASGSQSGYLLNTDWTTFNNKQNSLTLNNLSESTSDVLTITNGTGAIIGASPLAIQVKKATTGQDGFLSSADWNTFNGKQNALGYTPLNRAGDSMTGLLLLQAPLTLSGSNPLTFGTWTVAGRPISPPPGTTGFNTDVNQLESWDGSAWVAGASGTVNSVTASLPLTSSGGNNPNINLPQANAGQSGYLASSDWSSFSSKVNRSGDSMTGTLTLATSTATPLVVNQTGTGNAATFTGGAAIFNGYVGIGTATPNHRLHVAWLSGDSSATAFFGDTNNSTQTAVDGESSTGVGLNGYSGSNSGVLGTTTNGYAVEGQADLGISGYFHSWTGGGTAPTVVIQQNNPTHYVDLLQFQDSTNGTTGAVRAHGNVLAEINYQGYVGIGTTAPAAALQVTSSNSSTPAELVQGATGQAANLTSWESNSGAVLAYVDSTGTFHGNGAGLTGIAGSDNTRVSKAGDSMTGPLINNTTSASTALAINQSGTGAAIAIQSGGGYAATFLGGNVGIGTTNPAYPLAVESNTGGTTVQVQTFNSNSAGLAGFESFNDQGNYIGNFIFGSTSAHPNLAGIMSNVDLYLVSDNSVTTGGADPIVFSPGGSTNEKMRVTPNGYVGIGTTNPQSTLDMAGTLRLEGATSGYLALKAPATVGLPVTWTLPNGDGAPNTVLMTNGFNGLGWSTVASLGALPASGGAMSGALSLPNGTANSPSLNFNGQPNTGIYSSGGNTFDISTNGTNRMTFDSSGDVGIGTTTPNAAGLQIYYSAAAKAGLELTDTTSGHTYALSEDGAGQGSFEIFDVTNSSPRMTVTSIGNVGIGTTIPGSLLDVEGMSPNQLINANNASAAAGATAIMASSNNSATGTGIAGNGKNVGVMGSAGSTGTGVLGQINSTVANSAAVFGNNLGNGNGGNFYSATGTAGFFQNGTNSSQSTLTIQMAGGQTGNLLTIQGGTTTFVNASGALGIGVAGGVNAGDYLEVVQHSTAIDNNGNMRIGAPNAYANALLMIGAGTTQPAQLFVGPSSTSTPAIALGQSANLNATVNGALQYDGTDLYLTDSANRMRSLAAVYVGGYNALTDPPGSASFNSYAAAANLCSGTFPYSHMCTADEMIRSAELGISMPSTHPAWYSTGAASSNGGSADCAGWTGTASFGHIWGATGPQSTSCGTAYYIACCK